jgi:hypothetical protein
MPRERISVVSVVSENEETVVAVADHSQDTDMKVVEDEPSLAPKLAAYAVSVAELRFALPARRVVGPAVVPLVLISA